MNSIVSHTFGTNRRAMSHNPNKQPVNFTDFTSDFLLEKSKPEVFEFGSREYSSYWQEMDQQVYQQQQQYLQQQHQQTQLLSMMPQRQTHTKLDGNILTPTIEMDELIIKTEPPDDFNNLKPPDDICFGERSTNMNAFNRSADFTSFTSTQFYPIEADPLSTPEKFINFPRRKLQTERSETLPICQRCKQVFLKKSSYTKHVRHSICPILEHNFKCLICPMSFMSPEELQAHEHVHRSNQFFCQKYCGKYFDTLDLCEAHEYTFHDFDLFVCNVCMSTYKSQGELFSHKTQHCHLIRFDCPICRRWFTSTHDLRRHYLETPFVCGKFFSGDQIPIDQSEQYCLSVSLNESNYRMQDCNERVIKAPVSNYGNVNLVNFDLQNQGNNNLPSILNIKTEPVFDPTDSYYQNPYEGDASNFNGSYSMAPYSNFSNFQMMEKRYLDSFNLSSTYIPATPAVNEVDAICCVPHCGLRKSIAPTQQFFKFPKDLKYLKQWLHNMKLIYNPSESYEDYRICSQHFPKRVINLHSLCYWAVPTYRLGHDETANIFHNRDQNYHTQPKCSMPGCDSQRGKTNLKFFNFPTNDTDVYIKWCENTRLSLQSKETRQLCSRHFEDQCFGKIRLKVWAVPTLHLGGSPRIHDNPQVPVLDVKKCCLPHCRRKRSEDPSLSLYSFPKDELLFQRWCHNLKLHPMEYRGKFLKVCSSHFVKDVAGSIKLHSGAVPTLNLGHNDLNIYNNDVFTMIGTPSKSSPYFNSLSPSLSVSITNFDTPDTCSLLSCKRNRYIDNVTMHTMPGRPEMLQKWCHNIKMDPQKIPKYFRLCSVHFEPYCIGGCMRPFAVPTRHLGHDDSNIYHNPKIIKKLHIRETCCVPTCRRNRERDKANLHRFPLHKPELLQMWLDNLRRPMPDGTRLFNDSICERHFEERCIRSKRLERWAIPTLELGHSEDIIHLPTEAEVENLYARQINPNSNSSQSLVCCVESCRRNPKTDDVKLYSLPEDKTVLEKWSHNLQKDLRSTPAARICNLHFETRCINKRLQPWALPTLNLHSLPENLHQNPRENKSISATKLLGYAPRCCLPHCRKQRSDGKVQLFRFPSYSKSMLKKWCHNLQISTPISSASHRRVCSSHFEPHVLTKRCPRPNSVPTLGLNCPAGYKIYQNPERLKLAKLRAQRLCVIPDCRKSRSEGVQLFLYPHNRAMLRKWAHNTKQKAGECIRGQLRICSEHFESNCFGPVRLCPGAIPTLKLGHDDADIFPNNLLSLEEQEMRCIIADCKRSRISDAVKLFKFPLDDEDLLWKWCNNLKLNPADSEKSRICNMHFETDCVGPRGPFRWAIPTLLLGHDDPNQQLHLNPKPHERISTEQIFKCCVAQCGRTRKYDEVQLNSFPKTREFFSRWMHNLRINGDFSDRDKYRICNAHFEPQCIGKQRLNLGAIPTLELGHDSSDIHQVDTSKLHPWYTHKRPRLSHSPENTLTAGDDFLEEDFSNRCSYTGCSASKSAQRESYTIPKHSTLQKLWYDKLEVNKESLGHDAKLCGLHFIEIYQETDAAMRALLKIHPDISDQLQRLTAAYEQCRSSTLTRSMQCTVPNCKTTSLNGKGLKLYQFPYNRELCEKWCFNTTVKLDAQRRHLHKVCTLHFEHHCLSEAQRLRPWAIPTLHLPPHPSNDKLYSNPDLVGWNRRQLGPQSNKCCVPNCINNIGESNGMVDTIKLYNFPTDSCLIDKWLHNLRGCVERDKCPLYRICGAHFEGQCISKMARLRPWAIPTLELGFVPGDDKDFKLFDNSNRVLLSSSTIIDSDKPTLIDCKTKNVSDLFMCCVASCQNSLLGHGIRSLDFPTDTKILRRWCFNLQLPLAIPKNLQRICPQHFEKRCFNKNKKLHSWAIPTLNLGQNLRFEFYKNPKKHIVKNRCARSRGGRYLPLCCVPGCGKRRTSQNNLQTFAFPKEQSLLKQWCSILQVETEISVRGGRVCEEHFAPNDRFKLKLKKGVLPTRQLPSISNKSSPERTHDFVNTNFPLESITGDDNANLEHDTFPTKVKRCCITNCCNHRGALFPFPKTGQLLRRKWCHNTKQFFKERLRLLICSIHFESDSLLNGKPRPWAIPTLHLGHRNPIYNNPAKPKILQKGKCCISNCGAQAPVQLFKYPRNSKLLQKWAKNTKQDAYWALRLNYKVCSRHFETNCIKSQGGLNIEAIPTLHLEHLDTKDHLTSMDPYKISRKDSSAATCSLICCVKNCLNGQLTSISSVSSTKLWKFPRTTVLNQWCHNIGVNVTDSTNLSICGVHFEPYCFGKTTLRPWAIPTLLLWHDGVIDIHRNPQVKDLSATQQSKICCVYDCRQQRDDEVGIKLFKFPQNRQKLEKWLNNLKLPDGLDGKTLRICSLHFERSCFRTSRICSWAIPTLNLGHDDNSIIIKNPKLRQRLAKCCLTNCRKNRRIDTNIHLHKFPKISGIRDKWLHNLNLTAEYVEQQGTGERKLCSAHFEKVCFSGSRLKNWALPTLDLGHTSGAIYENPEQPSKSSTNLKEEICEYLQQCCVTTCSNTTIYQNLFGFPADEGLLKKWCENLEFENIAKYRRTKRRVCAKHFPSNAIRNNSYLPEVVPTLLLGRHNELKHRNPLDLNKYHVCSLQLDICLALNAPREPSDLRIFDCPKHDAILWKKWCSNLHLNQEQERNFVCLCAIHFVPEVIVGNKLKPGAVPTLHLGHSLPPTYTNSYDLLNLDGTLLCAVINCTQLDDTYLVDFPTESMLRAKWCANLKLSPQECLNKKICSAHFKTVDNEQSGDLLQKALPILNLGHLEQVAYDDIKIPQNHKRTLKCCVISCARTKTESMSDIQLYPFPKINSLLRKWCYNLRISAIGDVEDLRICSEHFGKHDLSQTKLKPWALPTLALGHQQHIHTRIKLSQYHELKKKGDETQDNYCAIVSCSKSPEDGVQLFLYPKDTALARKWAENCEHDVIQAERYSYRICSIHFDEHCLQRGDVRLRAGSVPTLLLGHSNKNINHHGFGMFPNQTINTNNTSSDLECCAPGCGCSSLSDNVRLFPFPQDSVAVEKWCHNLKLVIEKDLLLNKRVCHLHFDERCFSKPFHRLRMHAVPTLLLGHNDVANIIPNPLSFGRPDSIVYCCVKNCGNSNQFNDVILHFFPKSRKLFDYWMQNLKLNHKLSSEVWSYYRVCSEHFENSCYGPGNRLRFGSVPTLKLGHTDIKSFHHIKRKIISTTTCEEREHRNLENTKPVENCLLPDCGRTSRTEFLGHNKADVHRNPVDKFEQASVLDNNDDLSEEINARNAVDYGDERNENFYDNVYFLENTFSGDKETVLYEEKLMSEKIEDTELIFTEYSDKSRETFSKTAENTYSTSNWGMDPLQGICQKENKIKTEPLSDDHSNSVNFNNLKIALNEESPCVDNNFNSFRKQKYSKTKGTCIAQYCRIMNCMSHMGQRNIVLHKLPINPLLRKRWLYNSQILFDARRPWAYKICSRHFDRACYSGQRLLQWAVPTLHLGPKQPATIYPNAQSKKCIQGQYFSRTSKPVKSADFSTKSATLLNVETETNLPLSFNFKITAIKSISMDSSSATDCGGSINSTEPQMSMKLTSPSLSSKHSTSHLVCSLPSCQRRTNEDFVQLHMLPKDSLLQHKWCHNCRLTPAPHELYTTRVCSYHFEQHCFTRTRRQLKLGSIPTRHLGHQGRNIYRNARSLCESFACCVRGCGRRRLQEQARHFRLPLDKSTLDKWLHNLQMQFNTKRPWIYNVCEVHFEPYCFGKAGSLLQWAIPTLKLGHTDTHDIHLNEPPTGQSATKDDHYDDDALLLPECSISELNQYNIENNALESFNNFSHGLTRLGETPEKLDICRKCVLPHCISEKKSDSEINFFHFPNNLELRQKWLFNTKFDLSLIEQNSEVMQICEEHFEPNVLDVNKTVLKSLAVPTLKLGHSDNNIYLNNKMVDSEPSIKLEPMDVPGPIHEGDASYDESNKIPSPLELTKLYHNKMRCFLKHCRLKRGDGVKLFRFPRETELQLQWEHNLKLIYDSRRHQRHFLCNRHFEPELIGLKFLRRGAIPTLDLGHNDKANIYRPSVRPSQRNFSLYTHKTQQQQQSFACSVSECKSRETVSDSVLLFAVPKDQTCAEIWRQRLLLDNNFSKLLICSIHFGRDLISHRNLLPNALPTLHLPEKKSQLWSSSTAVTHRAGQIQTPLVTKSTTSITSFSTGCSVPGCRRGSTNKNEDSIKIFSKFPDDFELFTKWCFNLKIDPRKYIDGTYNVCSAHFEPNCISEHSLRIWAIPTLNLGHNDVNIHEVNRPAEKELKCCLPHCGKSDVADGVILFNFPKGSLFKKWCRILQIDELLYCSSDKKICSVHFTSDSIEDFSLKIGTKPSLHLRPTKCSELPANYSSESKDKTRPNLEQNHSEDDDEDGVTKYNQTFNRTTTRTTVKDLTLPETTETITSNMYDEQNSSLLPLPNLFEALHQQKQDSPNTAVITGSNLLNTVNNGNNFLPFLPKVRPFPTESSGSETNLAGSDDDITIIGNLLTEMLEDKSTDESF